MRITTEDTGTKDSKYYDGNRKMDAFWLKVRITTKDTGTGTLETGKKWPLEAPLRGLKKNKKLNLNEESRELHWLKY